MLLPVTRVQMGCRCDLDWHPVRDDLTRTRVRARRISWHKRPHADSIDNLLNILVFLWATLREIRHARCSMVRTNQFDPFIHGYPRSIENRESRIAGR
jgi:hypothetical protein